MARKKLMTWESKPAYRWKKMKAGVMYRVSCADLGLPETQWDEEASRELANEWWEKTFAKIVGEERKWEDRFTTDEANVAPHNYRLDNQAKSFLEMVSCNIKPKSAREIRQWFTHLYETKANDKEGRAYNLFTPDMDVREISEKT